MNDLNERNLNMLARSRTNYIYRGLSSTHRARASITVLSATCFRVGIYTLQEAWTRTIEQQLTQLQQSVAGLHLQALLRFTISVGATDKDLNKCLCI